MNKSEESRLGYKGGVDEILKHEWFEGIDVQAIKNRTFDADFIYKPELSDDPLDVSNFDEEFTEKAARHSVLESDDIQAIEDMKDLFEF